MLTRGREVLDRLQTTPNAAQKAGIGVNSDGVRRSAFELLSYPSVDSAQLTALWPEIGDIAPKILDQLSIDAQYAVYLDRQRADIEAVRRDEQKAIPDWLDYASLRGLSSEMQQKLTEARPANIAQAQKLEGVTPAAITLVLAAIKRGHISRRAS